MFRAGAMGSQAVLPGLWAGDQSGDWNGLQRAIRLAATGGMSGFATWGSDVGGYSAGRPHRRRLHALDAARRDLAADGGRRRRPERDAVGARRRRPCACCTTRPSCTTSSSRTSTACCSSASRCCGRSRYAYPDDPEAWRAELELLVGPDLLAAPVAGPGTAPSVYLPKGSWVDLFSGKTVEGRPELHARDAADRVPALRTRRRGHPVQPAHADGLVVGRERADAPGTRRLPRDERRDARAARPAGRRADLRPGARAARLGDDRRRRRPVDVERGAAAGRRDPARTARTSRARYPLRLMRALG